MKKFENIVHRLSFAKSKTITTLRGLPQKYPTRVFLLFFIIWLVLPCIHSRKNKVKMNEKKMSYYKYIYVIYIYYISTTARDTNITFNLWHGHPFSPDLQRPSPFTLDAFMTIPAVYIYIYIYKLYVNEYFAYFSPKERKLSLLRESGNGDLTVMCTKGSHV